MTSDLDLADHLDADIDREDLAHFAPPDEALDIVAEVLGTAPPIAADADDATACPPSVAALPATSPAASTALVATGAPSADSALPQDRTDLAYSLMIQANDALVAARLNQLPGTVVSGPFKGLPLTPSIANAAALLGYYETKLRPLLDNLRGYAEIHHLGADNAYYLGGFARLNPTARLFYSSENEAAIARDLELQGLSQRIGRIPDPSRPRRLILLDAEPPQLVDYAAQAGKLANADLIIDFDRFDPEAWEDIVPDIASRFDAHHVSTIIETPAPLIAPPMLCTTPLESLMIRWDRRRGAPWLLIRSIIGP